jgi:hemerythrin superfamily protein
MTGRALDAIERDHEVLAQLFDQVSRVDVDRDEVLKELVRRTAEHVSVEQGVLYPVVKQQHIAGGTGWSTTGPQ